MNKTELLGKHPQLAEAVPMIADVAAFMRRACPYNRQQGDSLDDTNAIRQLGKYEGWLAACEALHGVHEPVVVRTPEPVKNYSEPANK